MTKEVIGQDWSSEVVALFLEDWELGRVAFELPPWPWTFSAKK